VKLAKNAGLVTTHRVSIDEVQVKITEMGSSVIRKHERDIRTTAERVEKQTIEEEMRL